MTKNTWRLMLVIAIFFGSCISIKGNTNSDEKLHLAKQNAKPILDSLYNIQYHGYKWSFGAIEYDYLRSDPNVIVINTHLKSDKNYGIVLRVDTNFHVLNISNFISGFD